jgi:RimJ/RimL family protein N-acetyltransferase
MDRLELRDGRMAEVSLLSEKDSTRGLNAFINRLIGEKTYIMMDKRVSMKDEEEWKKAELGKIKKKQGFLLIARVGGRIAGTSGAQKEPGKGSGNVLLGIAIAKEFRGIGLGEKLLRLNISMAKKRLDARIIYLDVFAPNKIARALYEKLGFREFARYPKWLRHNGRYVDKLVMKLK